MTEIIRSTELCRRLHEVLDRVGSTGEPVIVQRRGMPEAVIIPYEAYAYCEWRANQTQRQARLAELRSIAEQVSSRAALTDEQADALIEEAQRG